MITGTHIRTARGMLGWSKYDLAQKCGVSYPTIQRAEAVDGVPRIQARTLVTIQMVLEAAGIRFQADGIKWVRDDG